MKNHAWLIPFAYGALVMGAALYWTVAGAPFDKATYELAMGMRWSEMIESSNPKLPVLLSALVRELGGNFGLVAGVLIMAIAATAFRNGEKWAWWTLWVLYLPVRMFFPGSEAVPHEVVKKERS